MTSRIVLPLRWLLIVVAITAGLLLPRWLDSRSDASEGTAVPVAAVEFRIPVRVEVLRAQDLEERLSATGTVLAEEWVEIVSEIAGKVDEVSFEEGRWVAEGAVLVRLETSTLAAERDRARHRYELVGRQESRQRKLLSDGLLSEDEYELTVGQLNVLRSELELREAILDKAEIRAPFSGRVGLRSVSPGAFLTPQTRVTTLQVLDPVKIEFSVPGSYARDIHVGAQMRFRVQGVDEVFVGEVYAIEPSIDPETRGLTLRARASNPERRLLPGAFAEVELSIREAPDALTVPSIAIVPQLGGKSVYLHRDGRAMPRPVETGIRTESRIEILSGLVEGDLVIVSNVARLSAGVEVVVESTMDSGAGE